MKKKNVVFKKIVKVMFLLLPEIIIISQLFFIANKIEKVIENTKTPIVIVEARCSE